MPAQFRGRFLLFGACLVLATAAHAQNLGSISGVVRSSGRGTIEGARVTLVGTTLIVTSDRRGEFTFHGLTPGKYVIQASAIGYSTVSGEIHVKSGETLEIEFEAEPKSVQLPDLDVAAKPNLPPDFLRRREEGRGRYFNREDIERRNTNSLGDLLRTVPGLRIECRTGMCRAHMMRSPRNCPIGFFVDGVPANAETAMLQPPRDLDGVEIYSGPAETPPELEQMSTCGTIALWTRTPPARVKREKPPKPAPDTTRQRVNG